MLCHEFCQFLNWRVFQLALMGLLILDPCWTISKLLWGSHNILKHFEKFELVKNIAPVSFHITQYHPPPPPHPTPFCLLAQNFGTGGSGKKCPGYWKISYCRYLPGGLLCSLSKKDFVKWNIAFRAQFQMLILAEQVLWHFGSVKLLEQRN